MRLQLKGGAEEPFNSAITAISSDEDSFIIEAGAGCLNGNLRGGNSISTKNMNVNGSATENADVKTPILFDAIEEKYFSDYESVSSVNDIEKNGNNVNGAVKISNKLELDWGLNLNGALETEGDLTVGGSAFNANNAVIVSETGNVTLKCDNISFSGLIYLPYGTLTIEGDNVNLNNVCIIADKISIKAKYNLNINASRELMSFVDENAVYDDNRLYVYAEGKLDGSTLTIKWYTNITTDEFNIYESENDTEDCSGYELLANVKKDKQYTCELNNDFLEKYYYVEADRYRSVRFKVINKNGKYTIEYKDSDEDGIPDGIEDIYGTNVSEKDSDGDGLTDYEEVMTVGTHPLKKDTNSNGVDDYNDDLDRDGLSNGYEVSIGTNPAYDDTDMDDINDYDELKVYGTDPTKKDKKIYICIVIVLTIIVIFTGSYTLIHYFLNYSSREWFRENIDGGSYVVVGDEIGHTLFEGNNQVEITIFDHVNHDCMVTFKTEISNDGKKLTSDNYTVDYTEKYIKIVLKNSKNQGEKAFCFFFDDFKMV